uniref:FH2 domain-containing protein n=1 Tax=Rhabditophanes sp. KR3021 TaxID=114890 RepID=A0AC35TMH4_9BILA
MWTKIDEKTPQKGDTIWNSKNKERDSLVETIDFTKIEEYFKVEKKELNVLNRLDSETTKSPRISLCNKIRLLNDKKIMNVDIFLKQFNATKLLDNINNKKSDFIGLERLKIIQSYLPDESEVKELTEFTGGLASLSKAECFLKNLISIEWYKEKILEMIFHEDIKNIDAEFCVQLDTVINGSKEILRSTNLKTIFNTALEIGNYLNRGQRNGNASGIKLKSIEQFGFFKTTKADKTFIQVLEEVTRPFIENDIMDEFNHLEAASLSRLEILEADFKETEKNKTTLLGIVGYETTNELICHSSTILYKISSKLEEVGRMKANLCDYFQETARDFQLEAAFKIVFNFLKLFRISQKENNKNIGVKEVADRKQSVRLLAEVVPLNLEIKETKYNALAEVTRSNINNNIDNCELNKVFKKRKSNIAVSKMSKLSFASNLEDFLNESLDEENKVTSKSFVYQEQVSPSRSEASICSSISTISNESTNSNDTNELSSKSTDEGFESDNKSTNGIVNKCDNKLDNKTGAKVNQKKVEVPEKKCISTSRIQTIKITPPIQSNLNKTPLLAKPLSRSSLAPRMSNPAAAKQSLISKSSLPTPSKTETFITKATSKLISPSTASRPQLIQTGKPSLIKPSIAAPKAVPQPRMTRASILAKKAKDEAMKNPKPKWI